MNAVHGGSAVMKRIILGIVVAILVVAAALFFYVVPVSIDAGRNVDRGGGELHTSREIERGGSTEKHSAR